MKCRTVLKTENRLKLFFGHEGSTLISIRLVAVFLVMMSGPLAHALSVGDTFYPKTAKQQARLMEAFKKNFTDYDFEMGRVAYPFKFEGRTRWHVNTSLYGRCMASSVLTSEFCAQQATIPNLQGKAPTPKGFEDEFSINVNSKKTFYSCEARLFVGKEDRELTKDLLEEIQETDPTVKGVPFVFVECSCEPLALNYVFSNHRATSCDAFGYATDASGN